MHLNASPISALHITSQFLPQIIKDNYGTWDYHEILKPGVMVHVGESGDKLFTVRAGTPRLLAIASIRSFADLADKYCDGYLRWTSRNNVEFLLTDEANIEPLIADLARVGLSGRRHGQRHLQHRAHPGLGALPLLGLRRLRRGQGRHGRDSVPALHEHGPCPPSCASPTPAA
jgi:hypothetical protein